MTNRIRTDLVHPAIPDDPRGGSMYLRVDADSTSFLKFDLSTIPPATSGSVSTTTSSRWRG